MKMPTRARECLALRFRQNWMAKHPVDMPNNGGVPLDDSLTSLNWLQNLNIMKTLNPTPPASPEPDTPLTPQSAQRVAELFKQRPGDARVNPNAVLNMAHHHHHHHQHQNQHQMKHESLPLGGAYNNHVFPHRSALGGVEVAPPMATSFNQYHDKIDYKTNSSVKPPYSYATLICMAMRESKKNKITLAGIYNWITENFMYYRVADPSWQNSIRHNLSLNKCFQKVARRKDEPGKGGFWRINPEYSDMFVNGVFKKRRAGAGGGSGSGGVSPACGVMGGREPALPAFSPAKKIKLEPQDDADEGYLAAMAISNELSGGGTTTTPGGEHNLLHHHHHLHHGDQQDRGLQGLHESLSDHRGILKSDFNWNAIFHQDIEVSGIKIKTEDIIDAEGDSCDSGGSTGEEMESPITALSPPASDSNSDVGLEDFLNPDFSTDCLDGPLDLSTGGELDLTITGHSLKAPDWWTESLRSGFMSPEHPSRSGLSTPVAPSPIPDHDSDVHPWAEHRSLDEAIANFDLDLQNLFEDDALGTPSLGDS